MKINSWPTAIVTSVGIITAGVLVVLGKAEIGVFVGIMTALSNSLTPAAVAHETDQQIQKSIDAVLAKLEGEKKE